MILKGLVYSYFKLIQPLKEYHFERYLKVNLQLTFFILSEVIPLAIDIVNRVIKLLYMNTRDVIPAKVFNTVGYIDQYLWTVYPLLQAFGMLVLKSSQDPINGISKLKYILIYSLNQIKLSSFKERITNDGDFLVLTEEAQNKMIE
jgi:hypothetical protein